MFSYPHKGQLKKRRCIQIVAFGGIFVFLSLLITLYAVDRMFSTHAKPFIYYSVDNVPTNKVALVLGTSKYIGRTLNTYYENRIDAAIELYKKDKIEHLLVSGDNAHTNYNEPWTMKRDLLKAGVPEENIHLDYAGFRTLDSIVRAQKVFKLDQFLIITQKFHCERALYIANYYHIQASCLAVAGANDNSGIYLRLREVFARFKAILDLYWLNLQPKFLGPAEPILSADSQDKDKEKKAHSYQESMN